MEERLKDAGAWIAFFVLTFLLGVQVMPFDKSSSNISQPL
jgi:hypothetical protein